ncbi:gtpase der [Holotrichia oblita]|uniref:Gtpase der n=1 Tax=Holotrichia oblita TaxID=644536 RepID=A0ACB9TR79_HOLOL|nr:gtpase der [Holotrichia oblita]
MGIVAIVGRPNVGKSTLFNRLVGMRQAIVDPTAGTTRDRHYGKSDWNGRAFSVIDTGGYAVGSEDIFEEEIRRQVLLAVDEADVILFMVEVSTGITDLDMFMAEILRRSDKKVIVVVNKVDNNDQLYGAHEFYSLGLGDPVSISSASGSGTGELMDAVVAALPESREEQPAEELPQITVVGRPNVGKSSLANALLGEERNIVTPVAGTTRDSIRTRYNKYGMDFYLIDTAGLRKKGKVTEDLEFYSVMRSIRAIENSDVCILMLDAEHGVESQDMNIFSLIVRNKKGCVIVVNKWDLVEKETNTMKNYREYIMRKLSPFSDVPIIFTSHGVLNFAEMNMKNNNLSDFEKHVIIDKGTEAPFTGEYCNLKAAGTYLCKQCGTPLYRSDDKFHSGCGWPSFDDEIEGTVRRTPDPDGRRTEITCARCGGHLGHVFEGEGFTPRNTRYCVNSVSLTFVPAQEGDDPDAKDGTEEQTETAIFAGGCFWGVEHLMKQQRGVISVESGYTGGTTPDPTYEQVCSGTTGHAEAVRIVFDPSAISYANLAKLFFEIHDPTQAGGQGPDTGDQYRSEVFYTSLSQKATAERLIKMLRANGYDVVTEVTPAGDFWKAEDYHQNYYERKGTLPYCHSRVKRF